MRKNKFRVKDILLLYTNKKVVYPVRRPTPGGFKN